MKKSELKSIIKPIIEECIRDVLLKEGMLSTIIAEVMIGISGQQPIVENNTQALSLNQKSTKFCLDIVFTITIQNKMSIVHLVFFYK